MILYLGPYSHLCDWLAAGEDVLRTESKLPSCCSYRVKFVVSYNYRYIIPEEVIDRFEGRIINLHISLLPWNRGADPNLWSWIDGTPKGVSIHYIERGKVDTGDIIIQREVEFPNWEIETLASTYRTLHVEVQELFKQNWLDIRRGKCDRKKQSGKGSYHRLKDREMLPRWMFVTDWQVPVQRVMEYGSDLDMSVQDRNNILEETGVKEGEK